VALCFIAFELMLIYSSWRLAVIFEPAGATEKWLSAYLFYFILLGVYTQSLSMFTSLNAASFFAMNAAVFLAFVITARPRFTVPAIRVQRPQLDIYTVVFLCLAATLLVLSIVACPAGDTYHWEMPKYWIQNESILPFETINFRHTSFAFLKETALLPNYFSIFRPRLAVVHEWLAYVLMYFAVAQAGERAGFSKRAATFWRLLDIDIQYPHSRRVCRPQ